jgi:hypothetical protein
MDDDLGVPHDFGKLLFWGVFHPRDFMVIDGIFFALSQDPKSFSTSFLGGFISHRIHGAAIYGNIYHQYTPNVSIYAIHGSYGY